MAAMADEWQTREIVNQTLLFFALGVRESFAGSRQPAIECPRPLPPVGGGRIEQQLRGVWQDIARKPMDPEPLKQRVKAVFTSIVGMRIDKVPRWKIGDVIGWWIASSEAVARSRRSGVSQESFARALLTAAAWWRWSLAVLFGWPAAAGAVWVALTFTFATYASPRAWQRLGLLAVAWGQGWLGACCEYPQAQYESVRRARKCSKVQRTHQRGNARSFSSRNMDKEEVS
jgi:hypothetical protein